MKLLFYGESPLNPTGFGHVNKHLLRACSQVADDVTCIASTHYREEYDRTEYSYEIIGCPIVPLEERTFPHQRNLENALEHVRSLDWDVFFYQGDMGWNNDILKEVGEIQKAHPEKNSIFYMPIDGDHSIPEAFRPFTWCSVPVVYTNHAKSVISRYVPEIAENTSVIWLGCDTEDFYPLSPEEKKAARLKFFGSEYEDRYMVLWANRNQARKDPMRALACFHEFHSYHPWSSLYMHSCAQDVGGSLPFMAHLVGCDVGKKPAEILFSSLDLSTPWARSTLNELYNACDVLISTSHGEGWGLTTTEAMCAGLPVVVPRNTANLDILGEQGVLAFDNARGWSVETGGDIDHTVYIYSNGSSIADIIHSDSFLDAMTYVHFHRDIAQKKSVVARAWCEQNTWKQREAEWIQLLELIKHSS